MKIEQDLIKSILSDILDPDTLIKQKISSPRLYPDTLAKHITKELRECQVIYNVMELHKQSLAELDAELEQTTASVRHAKQCIENEKAHQVDRCKHRSWLVVRGGVKTIECAICGKVYDEDNDT